MFGRLLLPSGITALVLVSSVAMPLPVAAWRHYRCSGWRRVLCSGPARRASQPSLGAATVRLRTAKCVLLCSPQSGRHSPCNHKLRQKYYSKYGALWTCPENTIFLAIFLCATTCCVCCRWIPSARTLFLGTRASVAW